MADPVTGGASGTSGASGAMIDTFGRRIDYLRLSLTDRCDFRCTYCLPEHATFAPRVEQLTIGELDRLASTFIGLGVTKLRLTGGEPLVRKGADELIRSLGRHLRSGGLAELTLTTNGSQLERHVDTLAKAGIRRINVSLDHLDRDRFHKITRGGDLGAVIRGIDAARAAGIAVKINTVVLRDDNLDHLPELVGWAHGRGMAVTLIEVMPVGDIGADRLSQHVPMPVARAAIERTMPLADVAHRTGGPARYAITSSGAMVGFITPLSAKFCDGCNRVRVDASGQLHACLGRDEAVDLKAALREHGDDRALEGAIRELIARKPREHDFRIAASGPAAVARPMAATGG
ncbi:GTP 3',8-cyclase MoaA [Sphingomonas jaspsi]|uniref:GTP 3',8-cyclase MoaA n=1 Tax=Sphingomonas jaspsi TaxID=392409 RepID=UPI0004B3955D|nr:GTP 3',8-cyclase MoaA [Sphingomonas jaspsi]